MSSEILTSVESGVRIIKFNRPTRKNAITANMFESVTRLLEEDANNDQIIVTILTGVGDFYSSGNDFKEAMEFSEIGSSRLNRIKSFVNAFINYPKILIAVLNGPAIGIAATTLGLCDIVYATENAWIETPFIKLGLSAEGCSSYTFPRIMGRSKASEMLFLNKRITAQEAYNCGLVAQVIPQSEVGELMDKLMEYGKLSIGSVQATKKLIVGNIQNVLCECNSQEVEELDRRFQSEDFVNAVIAAFSSKKSKL